MQLQLSAVITVEGMMAIASIGLLCLKQDGHIVICFPLSQAKAQYVEVQDKFLGDALAEITVCLLIT